MSYVTVWSNIQESVGTGSEQMDGVFIPIPPEQKAILVSGLLADKAEWQSDPDNNEIGIDPEYWDERMEATHWFIYVDVPEMDEDGNIEMIVEQEECTWWDFSSVIAKQVDGEWYVWIEDPGDIGNIWYQTTYTKDEAYGVRDLAIQYAERGELYNEPVGEFGYCTSEFYKAVKTEVMTWW